MYLSYFFIFLKVQFTYRFNVIFSLLATFCIFFTKVIVWEALYIGKNTIAGVTLDETILYAIISTLISAMMSTRLGDTLGENIYRGMVSIDFVRPVRFKKFYLAQDFAYVVHGLVNAMILAVVMTLFYGRLEVNITLLSSLRFCISVALALILNYQLTWLLGLTGFWLQTAWHIRWITSALIKTFSGTVVPLWFYPEWMVQISKILPYRYIYFDPISLLLGNNTLSFVEICGVQCGWIIGISIIAHLVWKRAKQKVVVQGG